MHNMGVNLADMNDTSPYLEKEYDGVSYVFFKTRDYEGNGLKRLLNMADYLKALKRNYAVFGKPDVIYASSPHLPSLGAACKIARALEVPCICEVRDLWPQSLIEYGYLSAHNPVSSFLFRKERKAYEEADALVFTMEGGKDYIQDKGWDIGSGGKVDLEKVYHINNGIDLDAFDKNATSCKCSVEALQDNGKIKIVYAGSVRKANGIGYLVEVAECMRNDADIEFVVLGAGDELDDLRRRIGSLGLENISFPGAIDKCEIPASLEKATLLLLYSSPQTGLSQYGMSQNKLFDYLASGKPVLSNLPSNYSIINKYDCGIERTFSGPDDYANQIRQMITNDDAMKRWGDNARAAASVYSFANLADKLVEIIKKVTEEKK